MWWKCPKGDDHEWQAKIQQRAHPDRTKTNAKTGKTTKVKRTGCPFCSGQRVSTSNNLAVRFPDIAAQWHPTKNRPLTPEDLVAGSGKKIWWKCTRGDDHEWRTSLHARVRGTGDVISNLGEKVHLKVLNLS